MTAFHSGVVVRQIEEPAALGEGNGVIEPQLVNRSISHWRDVLHHPQQSLDGHFLIELPSHRAHKPVRRLLQGQYPSARQHPEVAVERTL